MAVGAPCCFSSQGNIFITVCIIPKHGFLHGNIPPVLNSPAALIDYIASYKLSMVHKLCSAERNAAQCQPAGTCTLRAPTSEICLRNCAISSQGLEARQGELDVDRFGHVCVLISVF